MCRGYTQDHMHPKIGDALLAKSAADAAGCACRHWALTTPVPCCRWCWWHLWVAVDCHPHPPPTANTAAATCGWLLCPPSLWGHALFMDERICWSVDSVAIIYRTQFQMNTVVDLQRFKCDCLTFCHSTRYIIIL